MARFSQSADFSLDDFRNQLVKFVRPGLIQRLILLMPGMGPIGEISKDPDTIKETRRLIGIIDSMTPQERGDPKVIEPSRRQRIANGAGVQPQEVNQLVKQYEIMKPLIDGHGRP